MLSIPANVRVYLCTKATDMRKGFDGLHAMVVQVFERDPLDGHLTLTSCIQELQNRRNTLTFGDYAFVSSDSL